MRRRSVADDASRTRGHRAGAALVLLIAAGGCTFLETVPDLSHGGDGRALGAPDATSDGLPEAGETGDASPLRDAQTDPDGKGQSYAQAVMSDAPMAYYRFGEASGTIAVDETGLRPGTYRTGVTLGAAGAIPGDTAAELNGTTGGIDAADIDFSGRAPFTFEFWLRATALTGTNQMLFTRDLASGGRQQFGAFVSAAEGLVFERWVDGGEVKANTSVTAGVFVHVALVYDGSALFVYRDGQQVSSTPDTRSQPAKAGANLTIGYEDTPAGYFGGVLDEFAIYDKALSAQRIRAHFDARTQ